MLNRNCYVAILLFFQYIAFLLLDADKIENYENIIRNIHYYHNEPSKLSNRTLTLSCSSQNGRFISNKFVVRVRAGL